MEFTLCVTPRDDTSATNYLYDIQNSFNKGLIGNIEEQFDEFVEYMKNHRWDAYGNVTKTLYEVKK